MRCMHDVGDKCDCVRATKPSPVFKSTAITMYPSTANQHLFLIKPFHLVGAEAPRTESTVLAQINSSCKFQFYQRCRDSTSRELVKGIQGYEKRLLCESN